MKFLNLFVFRLLPLGGATANQLPPSMQSMLSPGLPAGRAGVSLEHGGGLPWGALVCAWVGVGDAQNSRVMVGCLSGGQIYTTRFLLPFCNRELCPTQDVFTCDPFAQLLDGQVKKSCRGWRQIPVFSGSQRVRKLGDKVMRNKNRTWLHVRSRV